MDEKIIIPLLTANDIDVRVSTIREEGLSLLLYKNARIDMKILDDVFGIYGWKREHELINGNLFCTVSIRDNNGNWVSKQDVGTESYAEKEKGQASDSFKRACFNLGIGRELYTAPFIWISSKQCNIKTEGNKPPKTNDRFIVEKITYDESRCINALSIINKTAKERVFVWQSSKQKEIT